MKLYKITPFIMFFGLIVLIKTHNTSYIQHQVEEKEHKEEIIKTQAEEEPLGYTQAELELLALTLYHEARGEPDEGLIAIGEVILNRRDHPAWGSTIQEVIRQPNQFSFFKDKQDLRMYKFIQRKRAYRIAGKILSGDYEPVVGSNAYHYYNPRKANPAWSDYQYVASIGNHRFLGIR